MVTHLYHTNVDFLTLRILKDQSFAGLFHANSKNSCYLKRFCNMKMRGQRKVKKKFIFHLSKKKKQI